MEKGEVTPDNAAPKSYFPLFVENYYWDSQYEFGDQTTEKNSQQRVSLLASWTTDNFKQTRSFPKNKSKIKRKSTTEILSS